MPFKFSGHETFPCRYTWLPKAYRVLNNNPKALKNDEDAMVALGIGKNMVNAVRFWIQSTGIAQTSTDGTYNISRFGRNLLSHDGFDPFLEDIRTLWLIHWQLSTHPSEPLFAWDYLLNRWPFPEMSRTKVIESFSKEAIKIGKTLSRVTLNQHFDVFLHTYIPTQSKKGEVLEDNLDCPLVELDLILKIGERRIGDSGNKEILFAFRQEEKPDINSGLFVYCLADYWMKYYPKEMTIPFHLVSFGHGSPGQVFKIPEINILERLKTLETDSYGLFTFHESSSLPSITRDNHFNVPNIKVIYEREGIYAGY